MDTLSGIYHPRNPYESPFYHCIADHFEEFIRVYDERYERDYEFFRPVIAEVIEKFLACGDLSHGFARVRCDHCGHEFLLALLTKGLQVWQNLIKLHPKVCSQ